MVREWRKQLKKHGREDGVGIYVMIAVCSLLVGALAVFALLIITNQGLGASIRVLPGFWSHLPNGNLLLTGHLIGWLYVVIVALALSPLVNTLIIYRRESKLDPPSGRRAGGGGSSTDFKVSVTPTSAHLHTKRNEASEAESLFGTKARSY